MFCNSTAESTKNTYSTSTNHFKRFIVSCAVLPSIRWVPNQLSLNGLIICFYTAYLFRLPSIKSATTIENYSRQLKSAWQKIGILLTEFDKLVLKDMIKGAKRLLPNVPDTWSAFLLPHYNLPFIFERKLTTNQFVLKAAVIQRYRIFFISREKFTFAIFGQKSSEWVKIVYFFFHSCIFFFRLPENEWVSEMWTFPGKK